MQEIVGVKTVENDFYPFQHEWANYYCTCKCGNEIHLGETVKGLLEQGNVEIKCKGCLRIINAKNNYNK